MSDFYESLFGCFDDCGICCIGLLYPWCLQACAVSKSKPNESWVLPLCTAIYLPCFGIGMCINRSNIRTNLGMQESQVSDFLISWCCSTCAACQEYREVTKRYNDHAQNVGMKSGFA